MKRIPLTQGKFALVDDEDYEWLSQWKWCADKGRNTYYASRNDNENKRQTTIRMHRELCQSEEDVDHIDGDGLNNQKRNLRSCSSGQNSYNQRKSKNNTSGFKGVSWDKEKKKWAAYINFQRKKIHLGYFEDKIDASKSYDNAAIKYFGEFASLNFERNTVCSH